jgi:hypothetical protein
MSTERSKSRPDPRQLSFPWDEEIPPPDLISSPEELGRAWLYELTHPQKVTRAPKPPRVSRPGTVSAKAKRPAQCEMRIPASARKSGGPSELHEASAST